MLINLASTVLLFSLVFASDTKGEIVEEHDFEEDSSVNSEEFKVADMPEFLRLADDSARKEYMEVVGNMNIPLVDMKKAQMAWAMRNGETVYSAYLEHMKTQDFAKREEDARMDKIVQNLSLAAQEADRIIRGIYSNDSLTKKQINTQVTKKLKQLPRKIYNELTLASQ